MRTPWPLGSFGQGARIERHRFRDGWFDGASGEPGLRHGLALFGLGATERMGAFPSRDILALLSSACLPGPHAGLGLSKIVL